MTEHLMARLDELARKRQEQLLDRTPKGRGADPDGWPRRHDEYE